MIYEQVDGPTMLEEISSKPWKLMSEGIGELEEWLRGGAEIGERGG